MGVVLDATNNQMFTIAKDKKLRITDLKYQKPHTDVVVGSHQLTCLEFDRETNRLFVLNGAGELFIYSIVDKTPTLIRKFAMGSETVLRGLAIDFMRNYLFTSILYLMLEP